MTAVRFVPIDLDAHGADCVRFRRDSFVTSFGSNEAFIRESGADGATYLAWLAERIREFPDGFVQVWDGASLVGQIEMRPKGTPPIGYVNLFYLVPDVRGTSLGDALHDYVLGVLRREGIRTAQLSVSPTNARARSYYRKHGWRDLGPRPGHYNVNLMELVI
jgi:ribosomal protein S18 acetylase RimI-like enzyme